MLQIVFKLYVHFIVSAQVISAFNLFPTLLSSSPSTFPLNHYSSTSHNHPTKTTLEMISSSSATSTEPDIPSVDELNVLLDVAIDAAKEAGKVILSNMNGAEITKLKANPRDLLTKIDPLCESIIKEKVLSKFPSHDFLGEEDVDPGKDASAKALEDKLFGSGINDDGEVKSDYLWIVDPIDGKFGSKGDK